MYIGCRGQAGSAGEGIASLRGEGVTISTVGIFCFTSPSLEPSL